ncbi:hypothetical protein ACWIUD_03005 [Helicobacter sp. 23-1044]
MTLMPKIEQKNMQIFIIRADIPLDEVERFVTQNKSVLRLHLLMVEDLSAEIRAILDKYELDYLQPKNFNFGAKSGAKNVSVLKNANLIHKDSANFGKIAESSQNLAKIAESSQNLAKIAESTPTSSLRENPQDSRGNPSFCHTEPSICHTERSEVSQKSTADSAIHPKFAESTDFRVFTELLRSGVEIKSEQNLAIFNRVNSGAKISTKKSAFIFGKCEGEVRCDGEYMILSQIANGKILFNGMAITQKMLKYKLNLIAKDGDIGLKISDALSAIN